MTDSAAWFEFNSVYFSPTKVGTVKIRQNRVFTLGDKWETLLVGDLFGQISRRSGSSLGKGGSQQNQGRGKSQQVRSIQEIESDDERYSEWSMNDKNSDNEGTIEFLLYEKPAKMLVDSGSTCDIVPEPVFKKLNKQLAKSIRNVYAYNSDAPLDVL